MEKCMTLQKEDLTDADTVTRKAGQLFFCAGPFFPEGGLPDESADKQAAEMHAFLTVLPCCRHTGPGLS